MSLPFDIAGSLWFMPTATWEWEPDPTTSCAQGEPAASPDGASDLAGTAADPDQPPGMRLVFVGYSNDLAFHWFAAETLVSHPWAQSSTDDSRRRHTVVPQPPVEESVRSDDDATKDC